MTEPTPLRQLERLFSRIDARVSDIIEHGASERLYFLRVDLLRVVAQSENLIKPVRERNGPISSAVPTHLLDIVRRRLRPPAVAPKAPSGASRSLEDLQSAIGPKPKRPGRGLSR
jgi:hypothetical protein